MAILIASPDFSVEDFLAENRESISVAIQRSLPHRTASTAPSVRGSIPVSAMNFTGFAERWQRVGWLQFFDDGQGSRGVFQIINGQADGTVTPLFAGLHDEDFYNKLLRCLRVADSFVGASAEEYTLEVLLVPSIPISAIWLQGTQAWLILMPPVMVGLQPFTPLAEECVISAIRKAADALKGQDLP